MRHGVDSRTDDGKGRNMIAEEVLMLYTAFSFVECSGFLSIVPLIYYIPERYPIRSLYDIVALVAYFSSIKPQEILEFCDGLTRIHPYPIDIPPIEAIQPGSSLLLRLLDTGEQSQHGDDDRISMKVSS